ncbi:hypothetical protein [Lutibacter sp.]|uniref:hypothetical protein n=1 Tax=Lutibacter sp. TaxID=1925666 RepID=UPI001A354257|nr:hypothetical protein [Lutibacter sp.]MBI9042679.1 hypothetical protein [Lutibacter sp.]
MNDRSEAFFKEATKKLSDAKNELFKPSEDFVSYSVCKNSQFAIENYLKGYLVSKNTSLEGNETIASLYNKCLSIDTNFSKIDLSAIGCKNSPIDSRYCSEMNSVSACFDAADSIDTYLKKEKVL